MSYFECLVGGLAAGPAWLIGSTEVVGVPSIRASWSFRPANFQADIHSREITLVDDFAVSAASRVMSVDRDEDLELLGGRSSACSGKKPGKNGEAEGLHG